MFTYVYVLRYREREVSSSRSSSTPNIPYSDPPPQAAMTVPALLPLAKLMVAGVQALLVHWA